MSPGFITTSLSRQKQKAAQRMSQRRSYQARQKIAKMKKVYKVVKEEVSKDKAHGIFAI